MGSAGTGVTVALMRLKGECALCLVNVTRQEGGEGAAEARLQ